MQYFGAAICELRRFPEWQLPHQARVVDDPGVCRQHPVDVGPDLDLGRVNRRPDERRGIIRAAAAESGRGAVWRAPYESADHGDAPGCHERKERRCRRFPGRLRERRGLAVRGVGHQDRTRVDEFRVQTMFAQRGCDKTAVQQLARRGDAIERTGVRVTEDVDRVQHGAKLRKLTLDLEGQRTRGGAQQPERCVAMTTRQLLESIAHHVSSPGARRLGKPEQPIRDLRHRGDNNDRRGTGFERAPDNRDELRDRGRIRHRGPAELHDYRSHQSSPISPVATISSAFSTAAPAAPRIVLCPRATSFTPSIGHRRMRPTVMVMPPSRSTSRRGCGRSGARWTTIGFGGAVGRLSAWGCPVNEASAALTSSRDGRASSATEIVSVWPLMTGTRLVCALTVTACGVTPESPMAPRILQVSLSIFSSSFAMNGTTLPRISIDDTPG